MRRILASGIAVAAMSGALLAGAAPASAAPTDTGAPPAGQQDLARAPEGFSYISWYWSEGNCEVNGARLQVRGVIRSYMCEMSPYFTYYLYGKF